MKKEQRQTKEAEAKTQKFNLWMIATLVIGIAFIFVLSLYLLSPGNTPNNNSVSSVVCGQRMVTYVNDNLIEPGTEINLAGVTEENGVYKLNADYEGENVTLYATKDCRLLFLQYMDVLAPLPTTTTQPTLVKTAIPTVDLYVMSFCPYGVQAENIMKPVVDLLGSKTNLTVRYIVRVKGSDIESVTSLHGVNEAKEDARQLCVMKYAPEQYWAYVMQFNSKCYDIGTSDEDALDVCWKEVATGLGIDPATIETCAYGTEGMAFLKADEAFTNTYGVTGSPTIVINGVKYNGARNSEAFKQAICSAFETVPAECSTSLSTNSTASSGSC